MATYGLALRAMRAYLAKIGPPKAMQKLHSHRNALNARASQLGWPSADRAVIGRWAPKSLMPIAYDRSKCVAGIRLRNDVAKRIRDGRAPSATSTCRPPRDLPDGDFNSDSPDMESSSGKSSVADDETAVAQFPIEHNDSDCPKSGYGPAIARLI